MAPELSVEDRERVARLTEAYLEEHAQDVKGRVQW